MINYAVIYSKKDEAGVNIAEQLAKFFLPQVPIIEVSKESIYNENIDNKDERLQKAEFIILRSGANEMQIGTDDATIKVDVNVFFRKTYL